MVIGPMRNQSRALGGGCQFTGGNWGCHPETGTDGRFGRDENAVCPVAAVFSWTAAACCRFPVHSLLWTTTCNLNITGTRPAGFPAPKDLVSFEPRFENYWRHQHAVPSAPTFEVAHFLTAKRWQQVAQGVSPHRTPHLFDRQKLPVITTGTGTAARFWRNEFETLLDNGIPDVNHRVYWFSVTCEIGARE